MKNLFGTAAPICGLAIALLMSAPHAAAQGPAGSGAAEAQQNSSRGSDALNPMKWIKKDSKNAPETPQSRSDAEKKLTPALQTQGLLAANATASDACAPFLALEICLEALHASHSVGVDFVCMRAVVTGVNTTADVSGCKLADGDRALSVAKAIHQFKPDTNAKQAAKDAERQAKDDLGGIGLADSK
jgi:hypothetical protein